ncbi:hypothetical protein [Streptomyces afghaniensis]|uniref:hypothetical protein n=1 Tax=Streptomyces afghaniensis TaxID=66865 RepID=UPI003791A99E
MLWALFFVLVIDAVTLAASGMVDITAYGNPQIPWAFLRIIVAFVNLAAAVEVLRVLLGTAARRKPWEFPTVLVGQASVIPMFIVPIMMEVESLAHDAIDIFLTALFASLLAVAIGISFGALVAWPNYLRSVWAVFIALLPLASLFQFWYQTFYLPTHERPTVNVEADLEEVRRQGKVSHMRGTVTMDNVGKATLSTLGSIYAVTGHGMDAEKRPMVRDDVRFSLAANRVPWVDGSPYKGVLKVGRLVRPGGHLSPGQKNATSFVFDVRNDAQQKVRLTIQLSLLVHSGELDFNPCLKGKGYDPDLPSCLEAAIPASNMFRDILGDRPVARTIVTFSPDASPNLFTRFQISDWDPKDKGRKRRGAGAAQEINPFLVSRGVTVSSEYRLDP